MEGTLLQFSFLMFTHLIIANGIRIVGILFGGSDITLGVAAIVVVVRDDVGVVLNGLGPGDEGELVLDANGLDHADDDAEPQQEQVPSRRALFRLTWLRSE